ncbi:MAG: hypothetical protein ACI9YH_000140 [Colwellia sp.]|jgi:hypothetical protein
MVKLNKYFKILSLLIWSFFTSLGVIADTQLSLFFASPELRILNNSSFASEVEQDINSISLLFDMKSKNEEVAEFSFTLTDQEKQQYLILSFKKVNRETSIVIKTNGGVHLFESNAASKRLQVKIEGLQENEVLISIQGQGYADTYSFESDFAIARMHLLHKNGQLNIYYLNTR